MLGGVEMLPGLTYDWIYIGTVFWKPVRQLLLDVGMPPEKLVVELPEDMASPVRTAWLECYAKLHSQETDAVAEGGVFRGDFAAEINHCFPHSPPAFV